MNRHFRDARYYLTRAGEHLNAGVREELEPVETTVREYVGEDAEEVEPETRIERLQAELASFEQRAEGEAREAFETARERLDDVRERRREEPPST